jgi:cytochrome c-type biogenesis protein CcmE
VLTGTAVPPAPRVRRTSRLRVVGVAAVVLGALGFLLVRLGDAANYFYTADQAVARRAEIGDRRIRIEGTVVTGSLGEDGTATTFVIESEGVRVPVRHSGGQPSMFREDIPVVLEGRFDGDVFASDRIMVKHSETYRAGHPDRVKDYPAGGSG